MSLLSPEEFSSVSKRFLSETDFDDVDRLEDGEYVFTIKIKSALIAMKIPLAGTNTKVTTFYISLSNAINGNISTVAINKLGDDFPLIIGFLKFHYKTILMETYRLEMSNLTAQYIKLENMFKDIFTLLENKND